MTRAMLIALLLTACAADDGWAPTDPEQPIVQAASDVPYCTRSSQCGKGGSCVDGDCVGELEVHQCFPTPCTEADGPSCVDLSNDAYNCGGCGLKCPWGTAKLIGCTDSVCYRVEPTAEDWANIEAAGE